MSASEGHFVPTSKGMIASTSTIMAGITGENSTRSQESGDVLPVPSGHYAAIKDGDREAHDCVCAVCA